MRACFCHTKKKMGEGTWDRREIRLPIAASSSVGWFRECPGTCGWWLKRQQRQKAPYSVYHLIRMVPLSPARKHPQARCAREREETARVAAAHARMEEEYRLALGSADQERARLEETIASLEAQLADERRAQAARYFGHR